MYESSMLAGGDFWLGLKLYSEHFPIATLHLSIKLNFCRILIIHSVLIDFCPVAFLLLQVVSAKL
jgi:hypothetical protein